MSSVKLADLPEVSAHDGAVSTGMDSKGGLPAFQFLLLAFPGLLLLIWLVHGIAVIDQTVGFTGFLVGAKLLGTAQLYDVAANLAMQKALAGHTNEGIIFVRMPYFALAMKPFLHLTYPRALFLWRVMMAATLIACALVAGADRRLFALALCWSVPGAACVAIGNDAPLILLCMLLCLVSWKRGRHFLAGGLLALCLVKFHFLVFLPLLLFRRENRRQLMGFSLTAAMLMAVNFSVQPNWLPLYWHAMNLPQKNMNAHATLMPNFYATFFWTGHPGVAVVAGALLVAALVYPMCRTLPFDIAMPICFFAGLLAAPHTNYLDSVLGIPAIMAGMQRFPRIKPLAIFLLSPIAGFFTMLGPATIGPAIVVAASLLMLGIMTRLSITHPTTSARTLPSANLSSARRDYGEYPSPAAPTYKTGHPTHGSRRRY